MRYIEIHSATNIQKVFRGFIVREMERIRGSAAKKMQICVNKIDFETMDEIHLIPHRHFFSYTDKCGFVYGFNAHSLMRMFNMHGKLVNPYNREDMPFNVLQSLFSIYKKMQIVYKE